MMMVTVMMTMVMMPMVTMVDEVRTVVGDVDHEKNGAIKFLAQMKGENRQRETGYEAQGCFSGTFTCATWPGSAAGSPLPQPAPEGRGLTRF